MTERKTTLVKAVRPRRRAPFRRQGGSMKHKARKLQTAGLLVLLLFSVLYSKEEITLCGNESSRFGVIQALGEQGVFYIEHTNFASTVDQARWNGHVYSDKPLPLSCAAALFHGLVHRFSGITFSENRMLAIYLVNLLFSGGSNLLLFLWMFRLLRRTCRGRIEMKCLLALTMCVSTWLLTYSVVFNNHTPAALAVLGLMIALEKYRRRPTLQAAAWSAAAAGIAGSLDIPLGFFCGIAAVAGIAFASSSGHRLQPVLTVFAVGGGIAAGIALLNLVAYGTILPIYLAGETYLVPRPKVAMAGYWYECLFGFRGLFSYQPFLLLLIPALWHLRKTLRLPERSGLGIAAAAIVFYLSMTEEYGGASYGMRYLIPVIPVFWFVISRWILSWNHADWRTAVAAIFVLWGCVTSLVGVYCPFCIANEGVRTPEGHFSNTIRSPFLSNLLVMTFERSPEGELTKRLIDSLGEEACFRHIYASGIHMRSPQLVAELLRSSLAKKLGQTKSASLY